MTTSLDIVEWIVCIVLGAGTLGVAAGLKSSPPELCEKIPIKINENQNVDGNPVMNAFKNMSQPSTTKGDTYYAING